MSPCSADLFRRCFDYQPLASLSRPNSGSRVSSVRKRAYAAEYEASDTAHIYQILECKPKLGYKNYRRTSTAPSVVFFLIATGFRVAHLPCLRRMRAKIGSCLQRLTPVGDSAS